MGMPVGSEVKA